MKATIGLGLTLGPHRTRDVVGIAIGRPFVKMYRARSDVAWIESTRKVDIVQTWGIAYWQVGLDFIEKPRSAKGTAASIMHQNMPRS